MNWRAQNGQNETTVFGETYPLLCKELKHLNDGNQWTIQYLSSDKRWLQIETFEVKPLTGEIAVMKTSHDLVS